MRWERTFSLHLVIAEKAPDLVFDIALECLDVAASLRTATASLSVHDAHEEPET